MSDSASHTMPVPLFCVDYPWQEYWSGYHFHLPDKVLYNNNFTNHLSFSFFIDIINFIELLILKIILSNKRDWLKMTVVVIKYASFTTGEV